MLALSTMNIPAGVPTRCVSFGRGAIEGLTLTLGVAGIAATTAGRATRCLLVCDANTRPIAERAAALLAAAKFDCRQAVLRPDEHGHVPGSIEQVRDVANQAADVDVILGVGSGVLNDLGKLASKFADCWYVSIATAASMNGYGSPIAAIVEDGVKKTLPAAATLAIVADLDVIAAAPIDMTRSGFADLLSKASATTDWRLASLVRGEHYDPRPNELLQPVVSACQRDAAAIGRADPDALGLLMQGLIYGAFAMTLAGSSSPASGGEHLLSHYWDMQAYARGTKHYLHGYQVAFGTRLCCALYQRLLSLRPDEIDVDVRAKAWVTWDVRRAALQTAHGDLFGAIEPEAKKQFQTRDELRRELQQIHDNWDVIVTTLKPMTETPQAMRQWLTEAGVPMSPAAVGQTPASVRHTLVHAADVRARFTVLDLARQLGVLPGHADELMAECGLA